jgi:hypothetical protein
VPPFVPSRLTNPVSFHLCDNQRTDVYEGESSLVISRSIVPLRFRNPRTPPYPSVIIRFPYPALGSTLSCLCVTVSRLNNKNFQQLCNRQYARHRASDCVGTLKAFTVKLRESTVEDVPLLKKWDEQDYIRAASGDEDYDDWNWEYELSRNPPPTWRRQRLAIIHEDEGDDEEKIERIPPTPIGVVQIIDPLEEESRYWWTREEESVDSGCVCKEIPCEANLRAIDVWIGDPNNVGRGFG